VPRATLATATTPIFAMVRDDNRVLAARWGMLVVAKNVLKVGKTYFH